MIGHFETKLFAPSSITYHAGIGDEDQFQVLTAGQEKFEQTPNSSAQEVFFGQSAEGAKKYIVDSK